ncbi:MAG: hypothetical protein LKK36_09105 [Ewingella americana]|uniref:hypothetical protein n=1 Tax=Ewingella americana TaxID=41202 RepID=UPI00242C7EE8|nr:hypothetical protein [Ewingella americana]MCI1680106.1 hypothetical protein [Ewingella americana]MCI1855101.1 hypothetical protein [Ewingella americana]MCI1863578.1 hypothetical protein [Ewingella americana]MCI2144284.1 hypothetical protein [Ewingella americana]MCI2163835.1 hypothetical protein [Ewingella americana]
MNRNEALSFLRDHQPMPDDDDLTQEVIDKYDEVRKFFTANPDKEVISLFLNSYGNGDGWGVYQLVEDVFYKCHRDDVVVEIKEILENPSIADSVRYWVTQVSAAFSDVKLKKGLAISLKSKNEDIRDAAQLSIDMIDE